MSALLVFDEVFVSGEGMLLEFDQEGLEGAGDPGGEDPVLLPGVQFQNAREATVQESEGAVSISLILERPHAVDVQVQVDVVDETPGVGILEPNVDFAWEGPVLVTIPAGALVGTFEVTLVDDLVAEPDETARFRIERAEEAEGDDPEDLPIIGGDKTLRIVANDAAAPTVSWSVDEALLAETQGIGGAVVLTVRVNISEAQAAPTVVTYGSTGTGSATLGVDYEVQAGLREVTIDAGDLFKLVTLTVIESDSDAEGVEVDTLRLLSVTGGDGSVAIGTQRDLEVTILEDDPLEPPSIGFLSSSFQLTEGPGGVASLDVTVGVRNAEAADLSDGFTASVDVLGGTATLDADYTLSATSLVFAPFETVRTFTIALVEDTEAEGIESIQLGLSITSAAGSAVVSDSGTLNGSIVDDDGVAAGDDLRPQFYYQSEEKIAGDTDTVTMVVDLGRAHSSPVEVQLRTYSGNATIGTTDASDVFEVPSSITVSANSRYGFGTMRLGTNARAGSMKWVVVELVGTDAGLVGKEDRFVLCIAGATDTHGYVPPEEAVPGQVDFRLYRDRVETLDSFGLVTATTNHSDTPFGTVGPLAEALWKSRNPGGVDWMTEGEPVVIQVMEDLEGNNLALGRGRTNDIAWSDDNNVPLPVRDLWIVGRPDGTGLRRKIPPVLIYNRGQEVSNSGRPTPHDNVRFVGIEIENQRENPVGSQSAQVYEVNGLGQENGETEFRLGVIEFRDCKFSTRSGGGLGASGVGKSGIRMNRPSSLWVRDCEFGSHAEHSIYCNNLGPVVIIEGNTTPDGTGRTQLQTVQRPGEVSGSWAIGFLIVADNTNTDIGDKIADGARAFTIYGHFGTVVMTGNESAGRMQRVSTDPLFRTNVRAHSTINARGNPDSGGVYAPFPFGSPDLFATKRCIFDNETLSCTNATDTLRNDGMEFSGCADLVIGDFNGLGYEVSSRPLLTFNATSRPFTRDIAENQIGENIALGLPAHFPNREDFVLFTDGPAAAIAGGDLLAYTGFDNHRASVGPVIARHWTLASFGQSEQNFTDQSAAARSAYDGSDFA